MEIVTIFGCIALILLGIRFFPATGWTLMLLVYVWDKAPEELMLKAGSTKLSDFGEFAQLFSVLFVVAAMGIDIFRNINKKYDLRNLFH